MPEIDVQASPRISELRGRLKDRVTFVLGNGPSVLEHGLHELQECSVIGMNASTILEQEHGFRAAYYVVSDERFITHPDKRRWGTSELRPDTTRVLREELRAVDAENLANPTYYVRSLGKNGFAEDLARGFYFGCSTSMLAVQLAAYLGSRKIVLLGNDFKYPKDQPRFYHEENPQDNDPFLSIQIWNIRNAHRALQMKGVELVICTRNSNLVPYIPYADFGELVREAKG